jgi:predicted transcriptional regulator
VKGDMGKSRKVPEDLMGTILREIAGPPGGERDSLESVEPGTAPSAVGDQGAITWEDQPWLVGTTFNLSKQLGRELDRLRHDLQRQEDVHTSNSEIAEVALRIAIEDARKRGRESELVGRLLSGLGGRTAYRAGEAGPATRRSVGPSGRILETIYNEEGEVVDEQEVGDVTDLPVETEYLDAQGRLMSLARDELGNTFEWVTDEELGMLEARIVRTSG